MMYIYHFNKQPKFCEIAPTEELCAKIYLHCLDLFIKMCLMMVHVNQKMYPSVIYHESVMLDSVCRLFVVLV